jgi:hypothetical protein
MKSNWDKALESWADNEAAREREARLMRWLLLFAFLLSVGGGAFSWYVWPGWSRVLDCRGCPCQEAHP